MAQDLAQEIIHTCFCDFEKHVELLFYGLLACFSRQNRFFFLTTYLHKQLCTRAKTPIGHEGKQALIAVPSLRD